MKEYTLNTRQITSLILVALALVVVVFFLGVTVGERHERARMNKEKGVRVVFRPEALQRKTREVARPGASKKTETVAKASPGKPPSGRTRPEASKASGGTLKKGYYIQVGAFREKIWARKWQSQAKSKGYRALVIYSKARNLYRVVIGPYPSKEEAVKVARKVDNLFKVRSSVVPDSRLR